MHFTLIGRYNQYISTQSPLKAKQYRYVSEKTNKNSHAGVIDIYGKCPTLSEWILEEHFSFVTWLQQE